MNSCSLATGVVTWFTCDDGYPFVEPQEKTVRTITGDDGFERCFAHVIQWKASVFAR